ncbi:hypothetical protein [Flavilitoribacter nigricans]|uniref:hypothetical protein n=1 Tax=Flavilitoribacter nigricans TaxID=70997 RepID=UPI001473385B|nr:hypothetical protein [Flavilitoribacter nigricans]
MSWIERFRSWRGQDNATDKPKSDNLKVAEAAKKKIEKVIDQPIVKELFQTDDDLGYC